MKKIGTTRFANRQFTASFKGTKVIDLTQEQLADLANEALAAGAELTDGYAPFCKHLFIANPTATKAGVAVITPENQHLLRSGYESRRPEELAVMDRWFEGVEAPRAEFLDIILYSREQLAKEDEGSENPDLPDAEWGIVAINGELQPSESPMKPQTQMRNALGKEQGGSGVAIDPVKYAEAVAYWSTHATIR